MGRERILCGVITVKGDCSLGYEIRDMLKPKYETDITINHGINEMNLEIKVYKINEGGN